MAAQRRRKDFAVFIAVMAMVIAMFQPALARRSLIPQKPSIEVNLEVLNDLKNSTMATPFGVGPSPTGISPFAMNAPGGMPLSGRKVPIQNQPYVGGRTMISAAPVAPMQLPPPPLPNSNIAMYQPGGVVQPMAAPARPASSYKPVKTETKKEPETETKKQTPRDDLPSIEKLTDALPEPDLTNMDFDDFPALQPLPPRSGSSNLDDIPLPEVPQVGNGPIEPDMPVMPDFTDMNPASGPDPMMPSLDQGFNDFITNDSISPISPTAPSGPMATPEMPGLPTLPGEQQIAMADEFPTIEPPTMETPSAMQSSGEVLLSIPYATTEDEVPVSSQKKLSSLAQQLISSGQPVEIRAYMKADSDSTVASSIGLRRSFAVRSYLIDSGVNENNVASVGNPTVSSDTTSERVDIVAR